MNEKKSLIKGVYFVEASCSDGKKVFGEVVDDNVVEEPTDNYDIVLWGFEFDYFDKYGGGLRE